MIGPFKRKINEYPEALKILELSVGLRLWLIIRSLEPSYKTILAWNLTLRWNLTNQIINPTSFGFSDRKIPA